MFYIGTDDGPLEVGTMEDICALVGETYTIEYDERQRTQDWLDTDSGGRFTFDVRETLLNMDFSGEFVTELVDISVSTTNKEGYPLRTVAFANRMTAIWDAKGALDSR
ncbi:hypothetical protein C448_05418 [Halococcus morrhuae DSM 1307]|uniref:Uncharacterized protein n=1 Tax=Halococcus morrhuae DSM 1307 TaxID=931277 RepID=M0MNM9_HALMO|nr:hypothetical protein C448_05418 [Halococcus morrhuae DSM 1307]